MKNAHEFSYVNNSVVLCRAWGYKHKGPRIKTWSGTKLFKLKKNFLKGPPWEPDICMTDLPLCQDTTPRPL